MKTTLKKLLPWIILVLVVGGFVAWYFISNHVTTQENASYDQKIVEAKAFYDSKEYSSAMTSYYDAVDMVPSRIEAFQGIMNILLDKNRTDDALAIIDKSAQKLSGNDQAALYVLIGNSYYDQANYDKALETYKKGEGLGINNEDLEIAIGRVYLKQGNLDNAAKQFGKDLYTNENASEAKLLLSYIQSTSDATVAKDTLASITPTDKWKPYFDEFSTVLVSLTTDTKFNATKLSRIYINNGYPYLAVTILEPMEAQLSEYLEGMYFLGRAYLETGQYDKAIAELDKALSIGGMEDSIAWTEARVYLAKNDLNNATAYYAKALSYEGKTPNKDLVSEYLDVLIKSNQTLKANEVVQSVSTNSSSAYIYIYGVTVNNTQNNAEKINYYLTQLGKLTLTDDENKEYLYWKAKALLDQNGNIADIQTTLDSLLKLDRYNPKYYLLLGRFQFEQGNASDAANAFKKAIEYDLSNSVTEEATRLLSSVD